MESLTNLPFCPESALPPAPCLSSRELWAGTSEAAMHSAEQGDLSWHFLGQCCQGLSTLNKRLSSIVNEEWVQVTGAALLGCEALDITFNFSEPPFPLL